MSSLWTDLLILHGHIHDPELVRRLANVPPFMPPPSVRGGNGKRQRTHSPRAALASLYAHLCLRIGDGKGDGDNQAESFAVQGGRTPGTPGSLKGRANGVGALNKGL